MLNWHFRLDQVNIFKAIRKLKVVSRYSRLINVKTCTSFFSQKSLIECGSLSSPPNDGCLQYHTGTTGIIKSFNSGVAAPRIITLAANDINYNICIRQEAGKLAICFLESVIIQFFNI